MVVEESNKSEGQIALNYMILETPPRGNGSKYM